MNPSDPQSPFYGNPSISTSKTSSSSAKPWILFGCGVFILVFFFVGSLGGFLFYKYRMKMRILPAGFALSGGKQLRAERGTISWRRVQWPGQPIYFDVPADWMELALEKNEIEFRPRDRSAYFIGHLTYFDRTIQVEGLLKSLTEKSKAELAREEISGYARKDFNGAKGLLRIDSRRDGHTMASWTGYFDTKRFGTVSVTFLLGAPSREAFEKAEPVLGAILQSIRFD